MNQKNRKGVAPLNAAREHGLVLVARYLTEERAPMRRWRSSISRVGGARELLNHCHRAARTHASRWHYVLLRLRDDM